MATLLNVRTKNNVVDSRDFPCSKKHTVQEHQQEEVRNVYHVGRQNI